MKLLLQRFAQSPCWC